MNIDHTVIEKFKRDTVDVIYIDAANIHLLPEMITKYKTKWISINTLMHSYELASKNTTCIFGQECSITAELYNSDPNTIQILNMLRLCAMYSDAIYIYNCSIGENDNMKLLFNIIQI